MVIESTFELRGARTNVESTVCVTVGGHIALVDNIICEAHTIKWTCSTSPTVAQPFGYGRMWPNLGPGPGSNGL